MRGGARPNSGRKRGEPTVRVRVPVGALPQVKAVVDAYLKSGPEIEPAGSPDSLKPVPEIKQGRLTDAQRDIRRQLEHLPKDVQRKLRKDYGTLTEAVLAGVVAEGRRAVVEID